jgi:hypothetical protein
MYLDQMGVPLSGSWEEATQTLTICSSSSSSSSSSSLSEQQPDGSTAAAATEEAEQQRQLPPEMLLGSPDFDLKQWLQALPQGVANRQHLEYAQLPLQVREDGRGHAVL